MITIETKINQYQQDISNIVLRDQIFMEMLSFSNNIAKMMHRRYPSYPLDETKQFSAMGLLRAIDLFKGSNNAKFQTYLYVKCIGSILDGFKSERRFERELNKVIHRVEDLRLTQYSTTGIMPSIEEVISELSVKEADLVHTFVLAHPYQPVA